MKTSYRSGFTLIELLVTLGIIGILVSLLLPAVQSARESSRRVQCQNQLHQIALAVCSYVSTASYFPPGQINEYQNAGGFSDGVQYIVQYSMFTRILPELELSSIYNQINYDVGIAYASDPTKCEAVGGRANDTLMATHMSLFVCPSDGFNGSNEWTGSTNYRANFGSAVYIQASNQNIGGPCGSLVTAYRSQTSLQSVRDGFSSTAIISEKLIGTSNATVFLPRRHIGLIDDSRMGYPYTDEDRIALCGSSKMLNGGFHPYNGLGWMIGNIYHGAYNHVLEPNATIPDCSIDCCANPIGIISARSNHPGGVNVSMADGSVRFVKNSISRQVWQAIGTKAGGETISDEDF